MSYFEEVRIQRRLKSYEKNMEEQEVYWGLKDKQDLNLDKEWARHSEEVSSKAKIE